jgi:hypothetical protein
MDEQRDEKLWQQAKKRADFQRSLVSYFIVNAFLWFIWWFTIGRRDHGHAGIPWPAWVMIGWGIGLLFQYLNAYGGSRKDLIDKEYEKLKNQNK